MEMKKWQEVIHNWAISNGFWDTEEDCSVPVKLCLIHSEISEVLEDYRNHRTGHMEEELADVIIRVLDLAEQLDFDMDKAIKCKMEKNQKRQWRNGGKRV